MTLACAGQKEEGYKIQKLLFSKKLLTIGKKLFPCILVKFVCLRIFFEVSIEESICWILKKSASDEEGEDLIGRDNALSQKQCIFSRNASECI